MSASVNEPCYGCWWKEGGRCYKDALADIHGLTEAPRNGFLSDTPNGLEITDPHLTACMDRGFRKSRDVVIGPLIAGLRSAGIKVERP